MQSYIPQIIQDINTVMGIVGFFISLIVMFQVRSIRLSFRARARLPEITKDLRKAGTALNNVLGKWPASKNACHEQIKISSSLIDDALSFVPRANKRRIRNLNKKMAKAARNFSTTSFDNVNNVWDLYTDIQVIITSLNQIEKNLNWE